MGEPTEREWLEGLRYEDKQEAEDDDELLTGIDQTTGPDKVWRCDVCDALVRMVPDPEHSWATVIVPVTEGPTTEADERTDR